MTSNTENKYIDKASEIVHAFSNPGQRESSGQIKVGVICLLFCRLIIVVDDDNDDSPPNQRLNTLSVSGQA